jgi:2'-5' RNA ligase
LVELVTQLNLQLSACDFEPEKRRFVPHVTLSRKVRNPRIQAVLECIHWRVSDFALAESVQVEGGVEYRLVQRWTLPE